MFPLKVLLVDDHPLMRIGIRSLLENARDIAVIGETDNGGDALNLARELTPDVMLLDMEMPGMNGVEVAQRLTKENSPVRVLILTAYDDQEYVQALLTYDIAGYITKEEAPDVILEALRSVGRGERGWVSQRVRTQLSRRKKNGSKGTSLTEREVEVLGLVVRGKTNLEIARHLGISEKTVQKHLEGVFSKLGVVSRVEAAVRVVRAGLV